MKPRIRTILLTAGSTLLSMGVVVACGEDAGHLRVAYEEPDTSAPGPSLPDASTDTAAPRDAGLDRGVFAPADEPVVCPPGATTCAVELVAGAHHFCVRLADGSLRCWGDDELGALGAGRGSNPPKDGDGGTKDAGAATTTTKKVEGITTATQLAASRWTTCARLADGTVKCWGGNEHGQLGLDAARPVNDQARHETPAPVALTGQASRVELGDNRACALLTSGAVWCWGDDQEGQLARPGVPTAYVLGPGPAAFAPAGAFTRLALGTTTLLGLGPAGAVASWGVVGGPDGLVGGRLSSISPDPVPAALAGLTKVSSLAVTASLDPRDPSAGGGSGGVVGGGAPTRHAHACAVQAGEVRCWGASDRGALCTGFPDAERLPVAAPILAPAWAQQVATGDEITCARLMNGTVQCCGDGTKGRLGSGRVEPYAARFAPALGFTSQAVHVATSDGATCALVKDGSVECWGDNAHGELGMAPDDAPHPVASKVAFE